MRCKFYKLITHFINKKAVQPAAQKVEASLVVVAAKRSNLQPPPEIKFNSKPATTSKF